MRALNTIESICSGNLIMRYSIERSQSQRKMHQLLLMMEIELCSKYFYIRGKFFSHDVIFIPRIHIDLFYAHISMTFFLSLQSSLIDQSAWSETSYIGNRKWSSSTLLHGTVNWILYTNLILIHLHVTNLYDSCFCMHILLW